MTTRDAAVCGEDDIGFLNINIRIPTRRTVYTTSIHFRILPPCRIICFITVSSSLLCTARSTDDVKRWRRRFCFCTNILIIKYLFFLFLFYFSFPTHSIIKRNSTHSSRVAPVVSFYSIDFFAQPPPRCSAVPFAPVHESFRQQSFVDKHVQATAYCCHRRGLNAR